MMFAIVALFSGDVSARTVGRSRVIIKRQAVQRLHAKPAAKKLLPPYREVLRCPNGKCPSR
jgi:hypothetical protein